MFSASWFKMKGVMISKMNQQEKMNARWFHSSAKYKEKNENFYKNKPEIR